MYSPFYGNLKAFLADDVTYYLYYNPKIIQEIILNKNYDFIKPYNTSAIAIVGKGLLFSEGKSNINFMPYISKTTLDIICSVEAYYSILNSSPTVLRMTISLLANYIPLIREIPVNINTGHETTNVIACWALYLLSEHPHEQDLLREELVKAFPDKSNFNPTFDDINSSALHKSTEIGLNS
ncbi:hypothetical protein C1646_765744 [Rhizophagus diaphanus]|nr:hypothetical protein C1646_765744 [Rhizophagus diaphanus] [Rhizophagus sp. MUCL 43196]